MQKRIRGYFRSTYVRYMVSYLLIMVLLVGALMVYTYTYFRRSMASSIEQSEINKLASVRYQSERYLKAIQDAAEALDRAYAADAASAEEMIARCEQSADVFERVLLAVSGGEALITSRGACALSELEYENADVDEVRRAFVEARESVILGAQGVAWEEGELSGTYLTVVVPMETVSAAFLVPAETYESILNDEIYADRSRHILFEGRVVAADDGQGLGTEFAARNSEALARDVSDTQASVKRVGGRNYLIITMPGNEMGLTYFTAVPTDSIYAAAANGWIGFVAILMVFAVPCIAIMVLISRLNLRTIREISARFGGSPEDSDEIHAIRAGIRQLDRELTMSLPARRIQFVQNLVRGHYLSREEADDDASPLGIDVNKPYYMVLLLGAPREGRMDVYLDAVLSAVPEEISATGTDLIAYEQILIVAFADDIQSLTRFAQAVCALDCVKEARVSVAASDVHDAFDDLPTAYLEANSAYENRFVMGEARLLNFKDISFAARSVPPQARTYVEAVKEALAAGDGAETNLRLNELLVFLRGTDMSLFAFRQVYNDVISALMSVSPEDGADGKLRKYDLFTLSNCRSIDELEQILRSVSEAIIEESRADDEHPIIQSILTFVTQNYTDTEFTLAAVAEKFGLTTARLTHEFKENMHMTPSDYLTMLRMEHAKKLLSHTERTIKDICNDAGYSDVSSFIRRFKMYAGCTPLQYRQNGREETPAEE